MKTMRRPVNPTLAVLGLFALALAVLSSNSVQAQSSANAPPMFADDAVERFVEENSSPGTNVGEPVTATDADNDSMTYSLSGTDSGLFGVDGASGQITVGTEIVLDYETRDSYAVTVIAVDPSGANAVITVTVKVIDMTLGSPYDLNNNELIDRDEAIAAVADYFNGEISRDDVIGVIQLYFSPTPAPASRYNRRQQRTLPHVCVGPRRHPCMLGG